MKRRSYVAALSSVGVSAVAGCTGSRSITGTPEPADLQVDSVEVLSPEIELREETTVEITVTNHGEAAGKGELWYAVDRDAGSFVVDIDGGESETYTESFAFERLGEFTFKLKPTRSTEIRNLDHSEDIKVGPRHLDLGSSWKTYEGYTITIDEPKFRESYEALSLFSGDVERYEPKDEDLFAFVPVSVENDGSGNGTVPDPLSFYARVDSELYELAIAPMVRNPDFRGDLDGEKLYSSGKIPSGTTKSGYLVFEVPIDAEASFDAGWSSRYRPEQVVYWS